MVANNLKTSLDFLQFFFDAPHSLRHAPNEVKYAIEILYQKHIESFVWSKCSIVDSDYILFTPAVKLRLKDLILLESLFNLPDSRTKINKSPRMFTPSKKFQLSLLAQNFKVV